MSKLLRVALGQVNPTVGDIPRNVALIRKARAVAAKDGADLLVFPELVLTGYPPEDLVLRPVFQETAEGAVQDLAADTADGGPALLIGSPWRDNGKLYNSAILLDGGKIVARRDKVLLPNYGVFDEQRLFATGDLSGPIAFRDVRLGVLVCEDMWGPDVAETLQESGAQILLVMNGSPFELDKDDVRLNHAVARITETGLPLAYVNQVGGQDELAFDGSSFVLAKDCRRVVQASSWREQVLTTEWQRDADDSWACTTAVTAAEPSRFESIYHAMVIGLRDYVGKNGFPGVIVGLSGGIDSALSAAVAADALGPENVWCVRMPSRFSSQHSLDDAAECARLLGVRCDTVPIGAAHDAFEGMLGDLFAGQEPDEAEENIQARARGIVLMALSNKFGEMVLTTGNKSEMSVGYATLYGDMCGGFSVLKDVYKSTVFALSRWRNQHHTDDLLGPKGRVIPENIITKPPSAELRPDQTDQDSLPPYDILDDILNGLVEKELSIDDLVAHGHDRAIVRRVRRLLYRAEYKRRQAPPGVKITRRAFGRDRRYPITNGFLGVE